MKLWDFYACEPFPTQSRLLTILWRKALENIVGKGENAVNQNFSFSHIVFCPTKGKKNLHLSHNQFFIFKCYQYGPVLTHSHRTKFQIKLKAFADDKKINVTKMIISVFDRVENIVGTGEIACSSNFSFAHNVFKRLLSCQKVSGNRLTHSLIHSFETISNSEKLQTTSEIWQLKDFKVQIA